MSSRFARLDICFLLLLLTACSFSPSISSASRYKILVSSEGLYRVTAADLAAAGAELGKIDPATIQLFHGDQEVAIRVQGIQGNFTFEFYAAANSSPYSQFDAYWFTWGIGSGKRMPELALSPPAGSPMQSFEDTIDFSEPTLYIPEPGVPGNSWFWQSMTAPTTTTVTATLPVPLPAPAHLRVNLWGSTEAPVSPNHHIIVSFNNVRVADEKWDGQGSHSIDAAIPSTALRAGENSVRLVAPGDTEAPADIVLLRSFQVSYQRRFVVDPGQGVLEFQGGRGTYRVEGFSGAALGLYDITNPIEPAHAANVSVSGRAIGFGSDSDSPRRWLAIDVSALKPALRIVPMTSSRLKSSERQADYIIIASADFLAALKPLVQWREQHGLKVAITTTEEIYDEFGFGAESPFAIRAFIDWAYRRWTRPAPRFVLLVGKASYDYLDYLNGPNKNLLSTFLVTEPHLGQAASDNWFVTPDDATGRPQLAIGRIPAKTADQVTRVVNKTITYESTKSADWRERAIFVADDKEPGFVAAADELAALTKMQIQKIYLAEFNGEIDPARAEILRQWNAGAGLITYIGHGSVDTWAAGPLFSADNAAEIKNGDRLPILFTPTCLDGFFYHPEVDSLAEDLLFRSDGGIAAGLVPTGLSLPQAQNAVMRNLFKELFDNPTASLGEAILLAKQETQPDSPDVRRGYRYFQFTGRPCSQVWRKLGYSVDQVSRY